MAKTSSKTPRVRREHIAFAILVFVLIAATIVSWFKSGSIDATQLAKAVETIRASTQPSDGRFQLQGNDLRLSYDGYAYLSDQPPTRIFFPDWRGYGSKVVGKLWTEQSLKVGDEVELLIPLTPRPGDPGYGGETSPTTRQKVRVRSQLRPGWYEVERREE